MSVTISQPSGGTTNNTLGMLGLLASIGGTAFGMPWLGALGMGMQGINAMMNGDSSMSTAQKATGGINDLITGLKDVWKNPSEGNIAKTEQQQAADKIADTLGKSSGGNIGSTSAGTASTSWPSWGQDYTDASGNRWEWYDKGGCFGTGGYRAYNPWNYVWDVLR